MRYAILADIHANEEALRAVLADARLRSVDRVVSLGDVVGFNAAPDECAALLSEAAAIAVAGNHDLVAIRQAEPDRFGPRARRAILWTQQAISATTHGYLESLVEVADVDGAFIACHGSLWSPHDYVKTPETIDRMFRDLATYWPRHSICFFGHTHRRAVHRRDSADSSVAPRGEIALAPGGSYLINPGSVGEPRDEDRRASYAILDASSSRLEYHRIPYDRAATLRRARRAGLPPPRRRLASVLKSILAKIGYRP
mgnify:CR=1 FL=1